LDDVPVGNSSAVLASDELADEMEEFGYTGLDQLVEDEEDDDRDTVGELSDDGLGAEDDPSYYRSEFGVQSSRWIHDKVLEIVANAPLSVHLSLETFTHSFPQPSVIARFEPASGRASSNPTIATQRIIIGAHQDSANYRFPLLPAPGADDDATVRTFHVSKYADRTKDSRWYDMNNIRPLTVKPS
ncbi:hypothetical protein PAXINDRAFT_16591, partial [Paxillus involutus ATCC 200175]